MKRILFLFSLLLLIISCNGQEKETYWKGDNVMKEDKTLMHGVTLAYMDMIAEMRIHLSKNNDSIVFAYPYEKKMKLSELKSLTDCRLKDTGELLDSVYDVRVEGNQLKIKFYYIGTSDKDQRFFLNLVKTDKETYLKETEKLREGKKKLLEMIKPIDVSALNLSINIPGYFKPEIKLDALSPIELAEDLCQIRGLQTSSSAISFTIEEKGKFDYHEYGIMNADKINRSVAVMNNINLTSLRLLTDTSGKKVEAWMVSKEKTDKKELQSLFKAIQSKYPNAKVKSIGEPSLVASVDDVLDLPSTFGIVLTTDNEIIKLVVKVPEDLYDKGMKNKPLPYDASSKEVLKTFEHYIDLTKTSEVKVIFASKKLDDLLNADGFSGERPEFLSDRY